MFTAKPARIQSHIAVADVWERVTYLEVLKAGIARENAFQQHAEPRNIPLAVSQFIDQGALGFLRHHLKCPVKAGGGAVHAQIAIQNQERLPDRIDDSLRVLAS